MMDDKDEFIADTELVVAPTGVLVVFVHDDLIGTTVESIYCLGEEYRLVWRCRTGSERS